MKRILIPLCLVVGSHMASGQRSYQFDAPNRLFVEGKELFSLKNYSGCIDKLEAYKQHSTDADLIQEADYMLVYSAYEQGRPNAVELLKDYLDVYPASRHADEVNFLIGSAHFGQGEYQKAIFWFNESNIDMLSPEQQEAYCFRLAYSCCKSGIWRRPVVISHGSSRLERSTGKRLPIMSLISITQPVNTTMPWWNLPA